MELVIRDRLDGIEGRDLGQREVITGRDRAQFPGFYAWAEANASLFGYMEDSYFFSPLASEPVVAGRSATGRRRSSATSPT